ncbi:hypothetical protein GO497_01160 [Acidovorax citrulli]|nr:hypothetical protein [Paracidovorax citrulli]
MAGGTRGSSSPKSFYAEGEDRFATLAVVTKKWPGEAAVISAHLSENDNRGDISFWERAQGVAAFKREFERESGRILTAAEINKELKERGLNYGLKTIQNFAFATEHLYPVGPWLQTKEVNEIIRPLIGAIQELSRKGDAAGQVKAAIDEILLMHGQDLESLELSNKDAEPGSRTEVRIDVQSLITDLQSVSAKVLRLDADRMPQILKEVIGNPKASFADLTGTRKEPPDKPPEGQGKARQMPLGPMLGSVTAGKTPVPSMERERSATAPGSQTQEERLAVFSQQLTNDFLALNDVVPISDFIRVEPALPFGFLVDFPSGQRCHRRPVAHRGAGGNARSHLAHPRCSFGPMQPTSDGTMQRRKRLGRGGSSGPCRARSAMRCDSSSISQRPHVRHLLSFPLCFKHASRGTSAFGRPQNYL